MFILHRLAQHLQNRVSKLGHLVQKQHSIVCQRHLTRLGRITSANECHRRGHMVRGTERSLAHKASRSTQLTRHGVYLGGFERLLNAHRGHNGRHTACKHSLTRARRANHNDVVTSCGGNLQSALGVRLALDIGEVVSIGLGRDIHLHLALHRENLLLAIERGCYLRQRLHAQHLDTLHNGSLHSIFAWHVDTFIATRLRLGRNGQHTPDTSHRAIQRQLTHKPRLGHTLGDNLVCGGEDSNGYGQVVARALLPKVGRGKVYHALAGGHTVARILEGRAYALLTLAHSIVGQAHKEQTQAAARDTHFDGDLRCANACDGSCICANDHKNPFRTAPRR